MDNLYCLRCSRELEAGQKSVAVFLFAQTVGVRPRQKSSAQRICFCPQCSVSLAMGPAPEGALNLAAWQMIRDIVGADPALTEAAWETLHGIHHHSRISFLPARECRFCPRKRQERQERRHTQTGAVDRRAPATAREDPQRDTYSGRVGRDRASRRSGVDCRSWQSRCSQRSGHDPGNAVPHRLHFQGFCLAVHPQAGQGRQAFAGRPGA